MSQIGVLVPKLLVRDQQQGCKDLPQHVALVDVGTWKNVRRGLCVMNANSWDTSNETTLLLVEEGPHLHHLGLQAQ